MQEIRVDINDVVSSLTRQIAEQAQKIAILEATIDAMNDAAATISREEQHRQIATATVAFLDTLGAP